MEQGKHWISAILTNKIPHFVTTEGPFFFQKSDNL